MIIRAVTFFIFLASSAQAQTPKATIEVIHDSVVAACPEANGVSIGRLNDKTTWHVFYNPGATCQAAAQQAIADFIVPKG